MDAEVWRAAGESLAIGLLVGAERERSKAEAGSAGVRTFAIVGLLGCVASLLGAALGALLLAGVATLVAISYVDSRRTDPGVTSEVALLATFALGALTRSQPAFAAGAAVAMTVVLVSKDTLHHFVRDTITDLERTDALRFFVAAFIVLPLLPSGSVGPYGVLVPQRIWLLVVLICAIGWVGYAATRALGASRGLLVAGLAGGFVSGTATIGAMGLRVRRSEAPVPAALGGALTASVATLVEVGVLTTIADTDVAVRLYPALAAGIAVLVLEALALGRRAGTTGPDAEIGRPFALLPAVVIAGVISGVLLLATWLDHRYGASGATLAAAIGSLADTHASAVAVATLAHRGELAVSTAVVAVGIGLATNTVSKLVAALAGGGLRFGVATLLWHLPAVAVVALGILLLS